MAQLPGNGFDPSQPVDDDLLPDGEYLFEIVDSAFKTSNNNSNATYIALTCDGKKGTRAEGMRIWQNFTYSNDNPGAVRMGQRSFKAICEAVGVYRKVRDTAILHGRIFLGSVCTEKGTGGYSDKNQFTAYAPANGAAATGAPPVPPQQQYQPPAAPVQQYAPPAPQQEPQAPVQQYQAPPVQQAPQQAYQDAPHQAPPAYQPPPAPAYQAPPVQQQQQAPQAQAAPADAPPWKQ